MRDTDIIFLFGMFLIMLAIIWLHEMVFALIAFGLGFIGVAGSFVIEWQREDKDK